MSLVVLLSPSKRRVAVLKKPLGRKLTTAFSAFHSSRRLMRSWDSWGDHMPWFMFHLSSPSRKLVLVAMHTAGASAKAVSLWSLLKGLDIWRDYQHTVHILNQVPPCLTGNSEGDESWSTQGTFPSLTGLYHMDQLNALMCWGIAACVMSNFSSDSTTRPRLVWNS